MYKMLKCSLCGKEFKDNDYSGYAAHVSKCAKEYEKKEQEDIKKINEELEELKRMKACYEGMRDSFKKKHPNIYATNFGSEDKAKAKDLEKKSETNTIAKDETNQNKIILTTFDKNGKKEEKEIPFDSKKIEELLSNYIDLPLGLLPLLRK